MMKVYVFLSTILILSNTILAQDENIFLTRDYWKAKPSIEKVKDDIANGNSPSELDRYDFDAIGWAILENTDDEILKHLLAQDGNDVNKLTHDGRTYIFWAAYKNKLAFMHYLLENGARTDIIDSHGYSLVNFCAVTGQLNTEIYDLCIEQGSVITEEFNNDGANPLLLLSSFIENEQQIGYFTDKGLTLTRLDNKGNNAFVYASRSGNMFMMNLLLDLNMDPRINNDAAFFYAARGMRGKPNKLALFKHLESLGLDIKTHNEKGQNLLHLLSRSNKDTLLLNYLVARGVSLNQKDDEGISALSVAVQRKNFTALALCEFYKADFSVVDNNGLTLLHKAVEHEEWALMDLILKHKVDINAKNNEGMTALHLASMSGESINFIKSMLSAGADKQIRTEFGENAYDLAIENELMNKNLKDLKILLP